MQGADIYTQEAKIISNSEREVLAIISNYSYLQSRRYVGDLTGVPFIMAFEEARRDARLLPRQAELLGYFLDDMSHGDITTITGMRLQSIRRARTRIIRKVAHYYSK